MGTIECENALIAMPPGRSLPIRSFTAILLIVAVSLSCRPQQVRNGELREAKRVPPTLILWAWDRAEDLRFLTPGQAEVAGLMATIQMREGQMIVRRRRIPLLVPQGIPLIAVIRLETDGSSLPPVDRVADLAQGLTIGNFDTLQIDFDARSSQLGWYQTLLYGLKSRYQLDRQVNQQWRSRAIGNVSMTALASWCVDRPWFAGDAPYIKEIVPMLFRMGAHRVSLLNELLRKKHFVEECRGSIGVSVDEPLPWYPPANRVYIFNPNRWTKEVFDLACARWR